MLYIGQEQFDAYYEDSVQMSTSALVKVLEENLSFLAERTPSSISGEVNRRPPDFSLKMLFPS
ncbi:hypothetical protein [Paenibacillus sp. J2TS4]|uniref:hypothetical protein n=1 Tax=Paenibacillus sp. J2TS4 TaxID=2807194 RepID=UPI001B0FDE37|nr:hypothetical protein [Paenibacillus sp. J2TS4]GIP31923.1 hypothetical protein J2TS4_11330 [Paenibacillus sp. J2TS4]